MTEKKNNIGLKVALGIALALFLGTGFYTSTLYQEKKENELQLTKEKQLVMNDLSNMAKQYDIAMAYQPYGAMKMPVDAEIQQGEDEDE